MFGGYVNDDDGDDDDDLFAGMPSFSIKKEPVSSLPPVPQVKKKECAKQQQQQQQRVQIPLAPEGPAVPVPVEGVPERVIRSLMTFDKQQRSADPVNKTVDLFNSRMKRSEMKVDAQMKRVQISDNLELGPEIDRQIVMDSLIKDPVGTIAENYVKMANYSGDHRMAIKRDREDGADNDDDQDQEEDDEENEEDDPEYGHFSGERFKQDVYLQAELDQQSGQIPRMTKTLLVPNTAIPDLTPKREIETFSEYVGQNPATKQFESSIRQVKGVEQGHFVEVRPAEEIYQHVEAVLDPRIARQQLMRYAVQTGKTLPDLPEVPRAEIQDALKEPDPSIGERECVYGMQCTSYILSSIRKNEQPEKYRHVRPFTCKEFYFGPQAEEIKTAMASGLSLGDVLKDRVMCVMCQFATATNLYKQFVIGSLIMKEVHVINAFNVIVGPGEYHKDACILGDSKFMGILPLFLKYNPDNYLWEPNNPKRVVEKDPVTHLVREFERMSLQQWTESPALDFQQGAARRQSDMGDYFPNVHTSSM